MTYRRLVAGSSGRLPLLQARGPEKWQRSGRGRRRSKSKLLHYPPSVRTVSSPKAEGLRPTPRGRLAAIRRGVPRATERPLPDATGPRAVRGFLPSSPVATLRGWNLSPPF